VLHTHEYAGIRFEGKPPRSGIFDAVIVGSGATGSWAAKALTEGGFYVALVEAGPILTDNYLLAPLSNRELERRPIQHLCSAFKDPVRRLFVDDLETPYGSAADAPFNWFRGRQVGGRLNTWSRHVVRVGDESFLPDAIEDDRSWPLRYSEVLSNYETVEKRLEVIGQRDGLSVVPDSEYAAQTIALPALAQDISQKLAQGFPPTAAIAGRIVKHNPNRLPLALVDAIKTNRLSLLPNSIATIVTTCRAGVSASGIEILDRVTGRVEKIRARTVVLAASSFETTRILLNSLRIGARFDSNAGNLLGHFVSDHVFCSAEGPLSSDQMELIGSDQGPPRDPWDFATTTLYVPGQSGLYGEFSGKFGIQISLAPMGQPKWTAAAFGEMLPRYENHIRLDENRTDAWGQPILFIDCRHRENEKVMSTYMQHRLSEVAAQAGLEESRLTKMDCRKFLPSGALLPGAAIHETGGARMGRRPENSIVNSFGQVWQCPNVFLVDGATFPYTPFQNPTLLMMALADRNCRYILANFAY